MTATPHLPLLRTFLRFGDHHSSNWSHKDLIAFVRTGSFFLLS